MLNNERVWYPIGGSSVVRLSSSESPFIGSASPLLSSPNGLPVAKKSCELAGLNIASNSPGHRITGPYCSLKTLCNLTCKLCKRKRILRSSEIRSWVQGHLCKGQICTYQSNYTSWMQLTRAPPHFHDHHVNSVDKPQLSVGLHCPTARQRLIEP